MSDSLPPGQAVRVPGLLTLPALAARVDRTPLLRRWDRRAAYWVTGLLDAAILASLFSSQSRGFGFMVLACAAFVLLIGMEAVRPCLDRRAVLWSSVALLVVAMVVAPLASDDVWSYAMYGHMVAHYHANPYTVSPLNFSGDPWFWRVSVWWQDTRSVYGPLFTGVSALGMAIAGNSALVARLFFQLLTGGSILAALALMDRRGAEPGALAFLGLSPMIIVDVVNGGHNDALVGLGALAAVVVLTRSSPRWRLVSGALFGLAALIKLIALLPAGALAVWLWYRPGPAGERRRDAVTFAAVVAAITAAGYLLFGGVHALSPVQDASRMVDQWSLWGWLGHLMPASPTGAGPLGGLAVLPVPKRWLTGPARFLGTGGVGAVALLGIVAFRRDRRASATVGASVLAFVLVTPYIQPWYLAAMLLPLAWQWRSRLALVGMLYSLVLFLADAWLNSTGLLRTLFRLPLSTVYPVFQILALAALIALEVQALGYRRRRPTRPPGPAGIPAGLTAA
ncbi:MAG TPA: glycosyltransferase 87 family protein [Actinomycetota bacterium]|nr:glycosyltransferase 87 family protein [Actinomycetota bacterium]